MEGREEDFEEGSFDDGTPGLVIVRITEMAFRLDDVVEQEGLSTRNLVVSGCTLFATLIEKMCILEKRRYWSFLLFSY